MPKLTIDRHQEAEYLLRRIQQDAEQLQRIAEALPVRDRARQAVERLSVQAYRARASLDDCMFREHGRSALSHGHLYFSDGGAHPED